MDLSKMYKKFVKMLPMKMIHRVVYENFSLCKKATIHQVNTMLATSKNVLFPGHNKLLTTGTDDPTLWLSPERQHGGYLVDRGILQQYELKIHYQAMINDGLLSQVVHSLP